MNKFLFTNPVCLPLCPFFQQCLQLRTWVSVKVFNYLLKSKIYNTFYKLHEYCDKTLHKFYINIMSVPLPPLVVLEFAIHITIIEGHMFKTLFFLTDFAWSIKLACFSFIKVVLQGTLFFHQDASSKKGFANETILH